MQAASPASKIGADDCSFAPPELSVAKERMIETLGEDRLLLPELIRRALAANDRVKRLLALVQGARIVADGGDANDLLAEGVSVNLAATRADRLLADSQRDPDGGYRIPAVGELITRAGREVETMLVPLRAAGTASAGALDHRLTAVLEGLPHSEDRLSEEDITRLTAGPGGTDSLHAVVMEAHRELNALAAALAPEEIDGAHVHELAPGDRELVAAFMRGVHLTEQLRFDHPGLGTIATRDRDTLVIQNDLGTTDAHVVVIKVSGGQASLTYTDVHLARLMFFQEMLSEFGLTWEDARSRGDRRSGKVLFHLASGHYQTRNRRELTELLERVGSRLVFIIDWNRARKRLRRLVRRRSALELLRWAADREYGHMAFLRVGGDDLVYEALEFAGGRAAHPGESLEDVLGAAAAREYLRTVLRVSAEGLLTGKTVALVQDEVRTELTAYLRTAQEEVHELVLRHAELSVEIAEAARDGVEAAMADRGDRTHALAERAAQAEHLADELLTATRIAVSRSPELQPLLELAEAADDIADSSEEAAFYATLLSVPADPVRPPLRRIARLVLAASRQYLRAARLGVELRRGGPREDTDAFLGAVHSAVDHEHQTDEAERQVHRALVLNGPESSAGLFVVAQLTRAFEEAADAIMHTAHLLRDQTLTRVARSEPPARVLEQPDGGQSSHLGAGHNVYLTSDATARVPPVTSIGAKAHGLARLRRAGLHVPEAAVLTTSFWRRFRRASPEDTAVGEELAGAVGALEEQTGLRFGGTRRPLLLSVRSGAPVSMPGMLETVLNVGLSESAVDGLIAQTGNPRLAWDSYRRLIVSFASVVFGLPHEPFAHALQRALDEAGAARPRELPARALEDLVRGDLERFTELSGRRFPRDPMQQLRQAVIAVLSSWEAPKAQDYRHRHGISDDLGTAAILQRMVFGNAGGVSGAGVGFTRDPALGEPGLYMDFLFDAQGEDVVAGRETLQGTEELRHSAPALLAEIESLCPRLEAEFADAQEFELTVQEGQLFLLQVRSAKRTPWAALRIASDQVREGLISPAAAVERCDHLDLDALVHRRVKSAPRDQLLATGIAAGTGVATGPVALDSETVRRYVRAGTAPVLVRSETVTEDIPLVAVCAGVLTHSGGRTSHAAVVARELGKPCIVGCEQLVLDPDARRVRFGSRALREGDPVCLDSESGHVYAGSPQVTEERPTQALADLRAWRRERQAATEPAVLTPSGARRAM